jgi:hypothetical protein
MPRPNSLAFPLAIVGLLLFPLPALADLASRPPSPPALDSGQQAVVANNPDLATLGETSPWTLRTVLARIAESPRIKGSPSADLAPLNSADAAFMDRNPALLNVYQASPEAAADLLALIKAAGGGSKR